MLWVCDYSEEVFVRRFLLLESLWYMFGQGTKLIVKSKYFISLSVQPFASKNILMKNIVN